MRKSLAVFFVGLAALGTLAFNNAEDIEAYIRSYSVRPCESWRWVRTSDGQSGYMCSFQGRSINVPDAYDVDRAISDLETEIGRLEDRVAALESRLEGVK